MLSFPDSAKSGHSNQHRYDPEAFDGLMINAVSLRPALKGRNIIAQGNALGIQEKII